MIFTENADDQITKISAETFRRADTENRPLLVASYGGGRDSTAALIYFAQQGVRPDIILMADTGAERDSTYEFLPVMNDYLQTVGFPEIEICDIGRTRDRDFETHLFRLGVFPSLTYGRHACSVMWKIEAQDKYLQSHPLVRRARSDGRAVVRAVFFEAGEEYRADRNPKKDAGASFAARENSEYLTWFPLIEAGIDFDGVLDLIWREKLPVPAKSSCYFCPSMREIEVYNLAQTEPHKFFRALVLERLVQRNKIVPAKRVQGLNFGKKWSDWECADPYEFITDYVIELFQLDRSAGDGTRRKGSTAWMPKAERVKHFLACFDSAEKLKDFVAGRTDRKKLEMEIQQINHRFKDAQAALPLV